jgi:DNA repair protein RadA/Sms
LRVAVKTKSVYRCSDCGAESLRWQGRCDTCGEWNTLVEEMAAPKVSASKAAGAQRRLAGAAAYGEGGQVMNTPKLRDVVGAEEHRLTTGLAEFDFVLGGGVVPGSMVLVGG